jgi:hypothetical protein
MSTHPTADILLFLGVQRDRQTARSNTASGRAAPAPAPAPIKTFHPGEKVIVADYAWDQGEVEIRAVVVRQSGEWVHVRVPDVGSYAVHVSKVHALQPEAA